MFNEWKNFYENDYLEPFNDDLRGLLWLKIKSIARKNILIDFLKIENIKLQNTSINEQFAELYDLLSKDIEASHEKIDGFLRQKNLEQKDNTDIGKIVSELYKLRHFDWGGDYKNALDKFLVDRYIKVYQNHDELCSKLDFEISRAVHGYVLCSWYNHWSSILIEHLFKKHEAVLPTVGQIKKVDFFIDNIPFDLKVTYLPNNFIETWRKEKGLKSELSELKQKAKQADITFTKDNRATDIYYEIVQKMKDRDDDFCRNVLEEIKNVRLEILKEVWQSPKVLIQNLYENQGEMRFDASNRLFLILIDTEDFDNSWKLKRNLDLLRPSIYNYLDNFSKKSKGDLEIAFNYKGKDRTFKVLSDVIFVIR